MKRHAWLLSLILVLALAGCAKPPKAEMDSAESAVASAAKSPDVAAYAPDNLQRAKSALEQMRSEATARRYDKAKAFAVEATDSANAAVAAAGTNKERAKAKAGELIDAVKLALPKTEKLLASAAKIKKANIDLTARKAEIAGAKLGLADAEAAMAKADYLKAVEKAGAAQKSLADIDNAISAAVQAATRKK